MERNNPTQLQTMTGRYQAGIAVFGGHFMVKSIAGARVLFLK